MEQWSGPELRCPDLGPKEHTWASFNKSLRAVLDCFFYRSKTGQSCLGDTTACCAAAWQRCCLTTKAYRQGLISRA